MYRDATQLNKNIHEVESWGALIEYRYCIGKFKDSGVQKLGNIKESF